MTALDNHDRALEEYVTKESGRHALQSEMTDATSEKALNVVPPVTQKRQQYLVEDQEEKKELSPEVLLERLQTIQKLLKSSDQKTLNLAARKIKELSQDSGYPQGVIECLAVALDEEDRKVETFRAKIAKLLQK